MATIQIQLDDETLERAHRAAEASHGTLEELFRRMVDQSRAGDAGADALLGLMSDEPDLVDEMLKSV